MCGQITQEMESFITVKFKDQSCSKQIEEGNEEIIFLFSCPTVPREINL